MADQKVISNAAGQPPASLLRLLLPLALFKWRIVIAAIVGAGAGYGLSYLSPPTYTSMLRLLPPQTNSTTASVLLNQVGGATSIGSSALGVKNPGDLYAGILRSRAVLKPVIQKLNLVEGYNVKVYDEAEKVLLKNLKITSGKDGILEVEITDKVPVRAALTGNTIIAELYNLSKKLTIQELHRREDFHTKLVATARSKLQKIEDELIALERSTGWSRIKGHEEAITTTAAELQGLIVTSELEIAAIQRYAQPTNIELVQAKKRLERYRSQVSALRVGPGRMSGLSNSLTKNQKLDLLTISDTTIRLKRDVKLQEAVLETAVRVAEAARVDEQRDLSVIQVLDEAEIPNVKSGPNRTIATIVGSTAAFLLTTLLILANDAIYSDVARLSRWQAVKRSFWVKEKSHA